MKIFISFIMLALIVVSASCKKFLETNSQNQAFLNSAADLDELLVGEVYYSSGLPVWADLLDDDTEHNPPASEVSALVFTYSGVHHWQQLPFLAEDGKEFSDEYFYAVYKKIAGLNTILFNVPLMLDKGEPKDTLRKISGEAHFMRAFCYFSLVNMFGKPYSPATAAGDYGIPLKTDPAVEDKFFTRATVKEAYDLLVIDLLEAEKELEGFNEQTLFRPNQAAAHAFLSRIYLYMEDYENAVAYADRVLEKSYRITDLNQYVQGTAFLATSSPEIIFTLPVINNDENSITIAMQRNSSIFSPNNFRLSGDLINQFSDEDLRKQIFFEQSPEGEFLTRKAGSLPAIVENQLIRLPEVYLNKAESLATLGRDVEAINTIQELRKKRFRPEDLNTLSATGEELVNFIRDERRRELCFESHRWFDLRRYGVNSRYPFSESIRHISYAYNNLQRYIDGYYELKPYDQDKAAYVMPVPKIEVEFGQQSITNEPRPDRPIIR